MTCGGVDLSGDGEGDLVVGNSRNRRVLAAGVCVSTLVTSRVSIDTPDIEIVVGDIGAWAGHCAVGDFTGDGRADLAVGSRLSRQPTTAGASSSLPGRSRPG